MATAVESLEELHDNYADYANNYGIPENFRDCLIYKLKEYENNNYVSTTIHGDTLTIGYGFNLEMYSDNIKEVINLLRYGLTSEGDELTQNQIDGLVLLERYINSIRLHERGVVVAENVRFSRDDVKRMS